MTEAVILQESGLNSIHFLLAYSGLLLSLLMKMAEEYPLPGFKMKEFFKRYLISILFSLIAIPVLLIVATDTTMKDFLPINYVTAVLAGWQTQAVFKSTLAVVSNRKGMNNTNESGTNSQPL